MKYIFDEKAKDEIKTLVPPEVVLKYYGVYERAKKGYNPFRNDHHPGSFSCSRGVWIDWSDHKSYDQVTMVACMEALDIKKDFYKILEKLAEIGGIKENYRATGAEVQKRIEEAKNFRYPNKEERALLGLAVKEEPVLTGCGRERLENVKNVRVDTGNDVYYLYYEYTSKDIFKELSMADQELLDEIVRNKALEKIKKYEEIQKKATSSDFSDPEVDRLWTIYERYEIMPEDITGVIKKALAELHQIYIKFGGDEGGKDNE